MGALSLLAYQLSFHRIEIIPYNKPPERITFPVSIPLEIQESFTLTKDISSL